MKLFLKILLIILTNTACLKIPTLQQNQYLEVKDLQTGLSSIPLNFQDDKWWRYYEDENLNYLLDIILQENRELKIAFLNIEKAGEEINLARSSNGPFITLSGNLDKERYTENQFTFGKINKAGVGTLGRLGVTGDYGIDLFGKFSALVKDREYMKTAEELSSKWILMSLSTQTVELYGNWIFLKHERDVLQERIRVLEKMANMNQDGINIGLKTLDSYLEVQKKLRTAQSALEKNTVSQKVIKNTLNFLGAERRNEEISTILINTDKEKKEILNKKIKIQDTVSSEIIASRPDVAYYLEIIKAQEEKLKYYKAGFYPQFSITGNLNFAAYGLGKVFDASSLGALTGIGFTFPIFRAGQVKSQYRIAGMEVNIFIEEYNNSLITAFQDVNNGLAKVKEAQTILEITRKSSSESNELYERARERSVLGLDSLYSLEYSRYQWLDSKIDYQQAEYNLFVQQIRLVRALGGLYE